MERLDDSVIDIDKEIEFMELGLAAKGTIEAGPDQQERLGEFTGRVGSGEFHQQIDWDHELKMLLARCVDGRIPELGAGPLVPNAAGGTETLYVADDLTTKIYEADDGTTLGGYANLLTALRQKGYVVGGHTDTHAEGEKSGCGANDKLPLIYQYIAENGDLLQALAEKIGVGVSNDTKNMIVQNAGARTQFSEGSTLLQVLEKNAKEEFVDHLAGDHKEVAVVINMRHGTTLDRDAVAAEFGNGYQAFNVDAWAFEEAARVTSLDEQEIQQKIAAMTYYNLATALVLGGPKLRVVVVR